MKLRKHNAGGDFLNIIHRMGNGVGDGAGSGYCDRMCKGNGKSQNRRVIECCAPSGSGRGDGFYYGRCSERGKGDG